MLGKIISKQISNESCTVYDISVKDTHNYYANGVLVHNCKTVTSQQGKNLLKLKAKHMIAMTGTPILNSPLDAYMPLKWIGKDNSTYSNFKYHYCNFGGAFNNEILSYRNVKYLKHQIDNCSLRRTKDLLDLPEKTIINETLDMSDEMTTFYQNILDGVLDDVDKVHISTANLLSMIVRLRQATSCPSVLSSTPLKSVKIERCKELVEEITANGNKVVVFSIFKEPLNILQEELKEHNPLLCTGDVADDIISKNIDAFQTNTENEVILCTTSKMGTGVTLTAASYAIFLDLPWTAAVTQQCEDRIHRIGSKQPVFIYRLHCDNTVDMRVKKIVEGKEAIGDYIVDDIKDTKTMELLKDIIRDLSPKLEKCPLV